MLQSASLIPRRLKRPQPRAERIGGRHGSLYPKKIAAAWPRALLMIGAAGAFGAAAGLPQTADAGPDRHDAHRGRQRSAGAVVRRRRRLVRIRCQPAGTFAFNQEGVTPNDELFNVWRGADQHVLQTRERAHRHGRRRCQLHVNVGGNVKKNFTIDVRDLAEDASQETMMACSCATGSPSARRPSWACRCQPSWRWPTSRTA